MTYDSEKTLTEIENDDWGEPTFDSGLIIKCHQLRKKPLKDFTVEDLRLMIGQNISLETLIPMAIERLAIDILAEGNLYPGDLLNNILTSSTTFWKDHQLWRQQILDLFTSKKDLFEDKSLRKIKQTFQEFAKS